MMFYTTLRSYKKKTSEIHFLGQTDQNKQFQTGHEDTGIQIKQKKNVGTVVPRYTSALR